MWEALSVAQRLERLSRSLPEIKTPFGSEVNNHVHSSYSFSPYTPSEIALHARRAGLRAVGIMDHDTVSGGREFIEACRIAGLASTCGFELRADAEGTFMEGKKINNPDSRGIFYMAVHGVAEKHLDDATAFLAPIRRRRGERNRLQTECLSRLLSSLNLPELSYERDVLPLSQAPGGGSVTERHILYALALMLETLWGRGSGLIQGLRERFSISVEGSAAGRLDDSGNPHYSYDLLGLLKRALLPSFYIQPDKQECLPVRDVLDFADSIGAVSAYAYLGDVAESPTGDKKAEAYEDAYLDELIPELKSLGFRAVTYMPPRNSREQLDRLMQLASEYGLMQISGVDINSSRQSFHCPEILDPRFYHLVEATWALIAHERRVNRGDAGLFARESLENCPDLEQRIRDFAEEEKNHENR